MADNIKVAVRVRPFNSREKQLNSKKVVSMSGATTKVADPAGGPEQTFTFDYSYDSFDSKEAGFAGQEKVFSDLGTLYLDNAWKGFNCSIFAYGQTGSGKSYSMMGLPEPGQEGIIPAGCKEMFNRIAANTNTKLKFEVEISYLEIYREKIRDLLSADDLTELVIRQDKAVGIYVQGLKKRAVKSFEEMMAAMDAGNKKRTVAATKMNATSSRSHSVFSVYLKVIENAGTPTAVNRVSKINLIDLAGSERQEKTEASGDRLKEAIAINQSLSALGNVIAALADKKPFIPYRDSILTRLLEESLGGNAKTIMIAAVSPAADNFDETVSTLRYADRAKKIVNKAVINESPADKMIKDLQNEIAELKAALSKQPTAPATTPAPTTSDAEPIVITKTEIVYKMSPAEEAAAADERKRLADQLAEAERLQKEMNTSYEAKLKAADEDKKKLDNVFADLGVSLSELDQMSGAATLPRLVNIAADPMLAGALIYYLRPGRTAFGTNSHCQAVIGGVGIADQHGAVTNHGDKCIIEPLAGDARVYVSGKMITAPQELVNGDRVILGATYILRFIDPAKPAPGPLDWEEVMSEFAVARGKKPEDATSPKEKLLDLVDTANDICRDLKKPLVFTVDISNDGKNTLAVRMINQISRQEKLLDIETAEDRVDAMREHYVKWQTDKKYVAPLESDPFSDPPADQHIGLTSIPVCGFVQTGEVAGDFPLVAEGQVRGMLTVRWSARKKGEVKPSKVEAGKTYTFTINLVKISDVPLTACAGVFCLYDFPEGGEMERTPRTGGGSLHPLLNYSSTFDLHVTTDMVARWNFSGVAVDVYGHPLMTDTATLQTDFLNLSEHVTDLKVNNSKLETQLTALKAALEDEKKKLDEEQKKSKSCTLL